MLDLLSTAFQIGQTVLFCIFAIVIYLAVKPSKKPKSIF